MEHAAQFSLICLYPLLDHKPLKGPLCISVTPAFLTPRAAPGTRQVLTSCLVNEKKINAFAPGTREVESNVTDVAVLIAGGEMSIPAVSTWGAEAPSHPRHRFPEPLTVRTCVRSRRS